MAAAVPESYATSAAKLRRVAEGLRLVFAGLLLSVLAALGLFFGVLAAAAAGPQAGMLGLVLGAAFLLMVFASLLQMYGRWRCRDLPQGLRAGSALRTTIAVDLWGLTMLGWALLAAGLAAAGLGNAAGPPDWLANKVQLAGFVAPAFFLVFLMAVARYIDRGDLAARARRVLVWALVALCGLLGMFACTLVLPGMAPGGPLPAANPPPAWALLALALSLLLGAAAPVAMVQYVSLLQALPAAALGYARRLDEAHAREGVAEAELVEE